MRHFCLIVVGFFLTLFASTSHARIPDPPWTPRPDANQQFVLFSLDPKSPACGADQPHCSVIEPIVWFKNYQAQKIPYSFDIQNLEPESKKFADLYLKPGQTYLIAGAATPLKPVTVDKLVQTSCVSLAAKLKEDTVLPEGEKRVVSNVNLISYQTPWDNKLYASHLQTITKRVGAEYLQKMPNGRLEFLRAVSQQVVLNKSKKPHWLVVEYEGRQEASSTGESQCCFASLVVYDLFTGKTQLQISRNADFSYLGYELLDATDVDGNGVPELIFKDRVMEVESYLIYKYKDGYWYSVYEAEGGGC